MCGKRLISMWDLTHSYARAGDVLGVVFCLMCRTRLIGVTLRIDMCDMAYLYVWHGSFICPGGKYAWGRVLSDVCICETCLCLCVCVCVCVCLCVCVCVCACFFDLIVIETEQKQVKYIDLYVYIHV